MDEMWFDIARRNARSVQTTIGWIFWDPGAVARYEVLGLGRELGYIAARCAPLAPAGPDAVIAAFGTISPVAIRWVFDQLGDRGRFAAFWSARDEAVVEGLRTYAPDIVAPLVELGPHLWSVVDQLPSLGRVFYGAHLDVARPADPLLSGWHAVNCVREWRGDTHWALVAAHGLSHAEASILHNEWMGYEADWLATSRGTAPEDVDAGWARLEAKGLAASRRATPEGLALRQRIEDETDERTTLVWELLGRDRSVELAERLEGPCVALLARVDETAGPNYMPASRLRPRPGP